MRRLVCVLVAAAALAGVAAGPEAKPAAEVAALVAEHAAAQKAYRAAAQAAKTDAERKAAAMLEGPAQPHRFAAKFVAVIDKSPDEPAAADAYAWLLRHGSREDARAGSKLTPKVLAGDNLVPACRAAAARADWQEDNAAVPFLRAVIDKNPHRTVVGHAVLALAKTLKADAEYQHPSPASVKQADEAAALARRAVADFPDVRDGDKLIGAAAGPLADELDRLSVGKAAPEIAGDAYDGRPMKLSDYRGKVVLLEFSTLQGRDSHAKLVARTAGKPFAVVVVDVGGDPAAARAFLKKTNPAWRAWPDGRTWAGPVQKDWHVRSYPMPYLIDPAGVIRYKGASLRYSSVREQPDGTVVPYTSLDDAVDALLAETAGKG